MSTFLGKDRRIYCQFTGKNLHKTSGSHHSRKFFNSDFVLFINVFVDYGSFLSYVSQLILIKTKRSIKLPVHNKKGSYTGQKRSYVLTGPLKVLLLGISPIS